VLTQHTAPRYAVEGCRARRTLEFSQQELQGVTMKRAWVVVAALLACAVGPAGAQQQPVPQSTRDPFNGQLGSVEIVRPPAEAARLARLMGDALDGLQPQRPGRLDTYVISVGFWGDAVFENEARQAGEILGDHLGAEGRTITLSAGGHPQRTFPAATPDNLSAAIGHIGSLIDPNEDLVVVFLTSHGSPDGSVGIRENNRLNSAIRATQSRCDRIRVLFRSVARAFRGRQHRDPHSRTARPHFVRLSAAARLDVLR
jgi:hypothetical protein